MQQPNKKYTLLATAIITTLGISSGYAAGFRLPEVSVLGTGTSNALVANTDELGALPYNPANMAFHDKNGVVAGVTYIGYDLKVDTSVQPGGGPNDSIGEDSFWVPNIYAMAPGYGNVSFGLGINAPFGLETSWGAGTFPNFTLAGVPFFEPELSRIEMINVNPNFAYKIDDTTSFALGIDFYDVRDLGFNTHGLKVTGNGSGLGWNIGFTKKLGTVNLGLSYRSSVDAE
jgi:long-chain fatty acid transport protein